jgi:hypothetical protein
VRAACARTERHVGIPHQSSRLAIQPSRREVRLRLGLPGARSARVPVANPGRHRDPPRIDLRGRLVLDGSPGFVVLLTTSTSTRSHVLSQRGHGRRAV